MTAMDRRAIESGVDGASLMDAAGRSVAEVFVQYIGDANHVGGDVLILCGAGNNGGDGFVTARYLRDWGYQVRVMLLGHPSELKGLAAHAFRHWAGDLQPVDPSALTGATAIIDALVGAGLDRPLEGAAAEIIESANACDAFRMAVDLPSGLNGETALADGACFKADATVTFFTRKPAHIMAPGRFYCGGLDNVHVANIGIPASLLVDHPPRCYENEPKLWGGFFPHNGPASHKYERGHVLVLGGKEPALGASRLSAMAALRVGAGLVTMGASVETYNIQAAALTDVMVRRFDSNFGFIGMLADPKISTVVMGPGAGVGEKTADLVQEVLAKGRRVVLDADALTSMAGRSDPFDVEGRGDVVLTPHEGEFKKLFPDIKFKKNRIAAARKAATQSNCIVVLKGVSTVVADPDGRVSVAANAPSSLSVGGTGDVLAGAIAGLLSQGMPPFEAASAGVWMHGEAANRCGRGMVASDLLAAFQHVLP